MSALIITLVPMVSHAQSYVTNDNVVISSQYHDLFNNYFLGDKSYQYFPYECDSGSYSRTCYYGIDSDFNYLNVTYTRNGANYETFIEKGIDENFSVSGNNIIFKPVSYNYVILYSIAFIIGFGVIFFLIKGWEK